MGVQIIQSITTIVIGFIAVYIAYQQWQTNKNKLKLDLFDKRYEMFEATRQYLASASTVRRPSRDPASQNFYKEFLNFNRTKLSAKFLFDDELVQYLESLEEIGSRLLNDPNGDESDDHLFFLFDALGELPEKFTGHMKLSH